jgi:hypothetical protein
VGFSKARSPLVHQRPGDHRDRPAGAQHLVYGLDEEISQKPLGRRHQGVQPEISPFGQEL